VHCEAEGRRRGSVPLHAQTRPAPSSRRPLPGVLIGEAEQALVCHTTLPSGAGTTLRGLTSSPRAVQFMAVVRTAKERSPHIRKRAMPTGIQPRTSSSAFPRSSWSAPTTSSYTRSWRPATLGASAS
jgi:hypothetical protein